MDSSINSAEMVFSSLKMQRMTLSNSTFQEMEVGIVTCIEKNVTAHSRTPYLK